MLEDGQRRVLSMGLSGLLRHDPRRAVDVDGEGWADLARVIATLASARRIRSLGIEVDRSLVEEVVRRDDKRRFELAEDGARIRATSGHSFEVDLGLIHYEPTGPLWFGTVQSMRESIESHGLANSRKLKVRLVESEERAIDIAVARGGSGPLVVEVDAIALSRDGYSLGIAPSGEVLVDRFDGRYVIGICVPALGAPSAP